MALASHSLTTKPVNMELSGVNKLRSLSVKCKFIFSTVAIINSLGYILVYFGLPKLIFPKGAGATC